MLLFNGNWTKTDFILFLYFSSNVKLLIISSLDIHTVLQNMEIMYIQHY